MHEEVMEDDVVASVHRLLGLGGRTLVLAEWAMEGGILLFWGKVYVPDQTDLRRCIVAQHHDTQIAGHLGRWKTLEMVAHNYWWPQMVQFIGNYTKTCDSCLWTKVQRQKPMGELHLLIPKDRWETISVDFISELLDAHGYDATMNIVDSVSKHAHFILTNTTIMATGAARLFLHHVWKHHGLPLNMVSD
jgi:Integrase zinc binding domain